MTHAFTEDPNSKAKHCTCGKARETVAHDHSFVRHPDAIPAGSTTRCKCGKPLTAHPAVPEAHS